MENIAFQEGQFQEGQRVEVWLAGWDQWIYGCVEQAGSLDGVPCARVKLDGYSNPAVFRLDQVRAMEGLFAL